MTEQEVAGAEAAMEKRMEEKKKEVLAASRARTQEKSDKALADVQARRAAEAKGKGKGKQVHYEFVLARGDLQIYPEFIVVFSV